MIEGHRIAGDKFIHPDERTQRAMQKANVRSTASSFKICLGVDGVPTEIVALRPSCFPRYDEHIKERMREWRYSPYVVNGEPVAVCTAVTFVFKIG